jgi:hypothetical protein
MVVVVVHLVSTVSALAFNCPFSSSVASRNAMALAQSALTLIARSRSLGASNSSQPASANQRGCFGCLRKARRTTSHHASAFPAPAPLAHHTLLSATTRSSIADPFDMASATVFRLAARSTSAAIRSSARPNFLARIPAAPRSVAPKSAFSSCAIRRSGGHEEETFEEFSARYTTLSRRDQSILRTKPGSTGRRANGCESDMRRNSTQCKMFLSFK